MKQPHLFAAGALTTVLVMALPAVYGGFAEVPGNQLPSQPSWSQPLGLSPYGQPLLRAALSAAGRSCWSAVLALLLTLFIAAIVGTAAGLAPSGVVDRVQQFVCRLLDSIGIFIPTAAVVSVSRQVSSVELAIILAVLAWPNLAQLIRAEVMRMWARPDVETAWVLGVSRWRILWHYITIPMAVRLTAPLAAVYAAYVAVFGALDYFGLGMSGAGLTVGFMVFDATENFLYATPMYAISAALALGVALLPAALFAVASTRGTGTEGA